MRRILAAAAAAVATVLTASPAAGSANRLPENNPQVQREFRYFRIQVYRTYRTLRPEYDHRRDAGEQAYAAWKEAGGQPHQVEPLIQWYRDAKRASRPEMNMPLPPLPEFPAGVATEEASKSVGVAVSSPVDEASAPAPPKDHKKSYRVREIATRSTSNPYAFPSQQGDSPKGKETGKPIWKSVSQALFGGMSFGSWRSDSEKANP